VDNIKTWTGLPVKESIRMTEDRDKWRKYVIGSRMAKEQNRVLTEVISWAMRKLGVEKWLILAVLSMYTGTQKQ